MDALETLRRREWTIAWVRWSAATLAAGQIVLGGSVSVPVTLSFVVVLGVLGVAVAAAEDRLVTAAAWRQMSAVLMGADTVVALGLIQAGLREGNGELWVLLVLIVLEGALRYRLQGAVAVALGSGAAYAILNALAGGVSPGGTILSRVLFLAVVGGFAGAIARELDVERRLYQRMAEASQDIVAQRDEASILAALAGHVNQTLQAERSQVYRYSLTGFDQVLERRRPGLVDSTDPLLGDGEDGVSAILHRLTWRQGSNGVPNRLTLPIRLPERPAEYVVAVESSHPRPSALAEGALMSLAESTAVSLTTRDLIRSQDASNRRLERLEALRTRFVATVAHDLRSPLTTVKGVASILRGRRDTVSPEQVDTMLASVERQANRLNRLADDLLDAARLDSEQLELKRRAVSIQGILNAVEADAADDVRLIVQDGLTVNADGPRLERVVWNLVSNALKYGRPPVVITASSEGDTLVITVRDHGKGLDQAQIDNLFVDFAGNDDPDSVGLGLAIVWELVHAHGGTVTYAAGNPGALFTVCIPGSVVLADPV